MPEFLNTVSNYDDFDRRQIVADLITLEYFNLIKYCRVKPNHAESLRIKLQAKSVCNRALLHSFCFLLQPSMGMFNFNNESDNA